MKDITHRNGPRIVSVKDFRIDSEYIAWISEIKRRYISAQITKDNYDFGFITVPNDYREEQLEAALEKNITRFLLELGTGFAFVGRQKELIVGNRTRRIDSCFIISV